MSRVPWTALDALAGATLPQDLQAMSDHDRSRRVPELSFLDTFWKKESGSTRWAPRRGSLSVRTKSSGTDGSTETAVQSDSGRDHQCTTHKRRWYLSDRITTPIHVGVKQIFLRPDKLDSTLVECATDVDHHS